MIMKPMLASPLNWDKLRYPVDASVKLDGVRCVVQDGVPWSRTHKVLRNRHLQNLVANADVHYDVDNLDGELVVGSATAPNVMQATTSGIMSESGTPNITYFVFDDVTNPNEPYWKRYKDLQERRLPPWVQILPQLRCGGQLEVERAEAEAIELGYEGLIVRTPFGHYKQGRSTVNEGLLLKVKRFVDAEAVVVGVEELYHNDNEAIIDVQGHTTRSSHKAGQRPGGVLGALTVELLDKDKVGRVVFSIGSGFTFQQRREFWQNRNRLINKIVKFKSQPTGVLDAPRFPIFLSFRHPLDVPEPGE